jgi:hypothetical protein
LRKIVDKANRGNVSATSARQYRGDFDALTRKFDGILQGTKKSTTDVLDVTAMEGALVKSGLDQSKISELANMLRKITRPNDTVVDAQGNVTSDGNPIPLVDFQKSLRAAIFDEDDPTDDKSGFFARASAKLRQVESRLQTNVKAITQTRGLVKENLDLVRAAGLAFLDVSNAMSGSESVDQVTETIRAKIRSSAPGALAQAHNLEGVLVASLASLNGQTSGS